MFRKLGRRFLFDDKSNDRNKRSNFSFKRNYSTDASILNSQNLHGNQNVIGHKRESKLSSLLKSLINRGNKNKNTIDLESKTIFSKIISESSKTRKQFQNDIDKPSFTNRNIEVITISSGESSPIITSERGEKTISIKETSSEVETITISSKEVSPSCSINGHSKLDFRSNFQFESSALKKLESLDRDVKRLLEYSSDKKTFSKCKSVKCEDMSGILSPCEQTFVYDEHSRLSTPKTSSVGSRKRGYTFIEDEKRVEYSKKIKLLEMEVDNQVFGFQQNLNFHDILVPRKNFINIKIAGSDYKRLPIDLNDVFEKIESAGVNDVLSEGFSMSITKNDILHLNDQKWLNDNIINFYLELIMERSRNSIKYPKVYAFNTFFYVNIVNPQRGYKMVRRWTRKVDIFQMEYIFVPINKNNVHWCMAIINVPKKEIRYCDSMRQENLEALEAIKSYIKSEAADKLKIDINLDEWTAFHAQDVPQQGNGFDCGVFTCMFAEYQSRGRDFEFTQNDMPFFRQKMNMIIEELEINHFKDGVIDLISGTMGGVANVYSGQPLDTVKVKMQTFPKLYIDWKKCFRETYNSSGIRGLYAGTVPALIANVAENAVLFTAYGYCQKIVAKITNKQDVCSLTPIENASSGALAAVFAAMALCPTELVKCRLQAAKEMKPNIKRTTLSICKDVWKESGFKGFFIGLTPTLAREVPGYFAFFGAYETCRYMITKEGQSKDDIGIAYTALSGSMAGVTLWCLVFPFDVIKSRMQVQGNNSFVKTLKDTLRHYGPSGLYKGLLPTIIRSFSASGCLFITYEYTKKFLNFVW
uniref:Ubiquitin-like protease family profile domain-containing protein n=1 Tax=Strongyloides stercoralis TaxID=6248 RepID=A0AAF5D9B4_STRER